VLGIDAAWVAHNPAGVAVAVRAGKGWRLAGLAPSYDQFMDLAAGRPVDWSVRPPGGKPYIPDLLAAAGRLAGAPVTLATIDMPVGTELVTGRRASDREINRAFAANWCATHSPQPDRPGPFGHAIAKDFRAAGFPVAPATGRVGTRKRLLEVYPHAAVLRLLGLEKRAPYKVQNSRRYWPGTSLAGRRAKLLAWHGRIAAALAGELGELPDPGIPPKGLSALKRREDAIDAAVCAWVGCRYLDGCAEAFGDDTSAIWAPCM
jgi:predicted RNase H-like nuclease